MCVYRQAIPSLLFLKSAYENLAWYKKIFFPGTLAKALKEVSEKTEAKAIHTICMAVENSWFSRFFVCLRQFEQSEIMIFFRASDKTKLTSVIALPDESKPYALASGVALSSSPGSDLSGEATAKELMQQRAFVEKKDKLADKCNELMRLVTMDVQHLDTLCIPYESTIRNCDRIKVELRYQELQKSAMKIDPNATDKQFVGMFCCKCGARSRNFGYCFQCADIPYSIIKYQDKKIPDEDARSSAQAKYLLLQVELKVETEKSLSPPPEYRKRKALKSIMQKLQTLTSEISKAQEDDILSIALTRYREILDEMEPCVLENQTLRKSDFLPVGDYAQYNNGRQDALFQSLPNEQNEFAAEEVIDPDFPQQILGFRN